MLSRITLSLFVSLSLSMDGAAWGLPFYEEQRSATISTPLSEADRRLLSGAKINCLSVEGNASPDLFDDRQLFPELSIVFLRCYENREHLALLSRTYRERVKVICLSQSYPVTGRYFADFRRLKVLEISGLVQDGALESALPSSLQSLRLTGMTRLKHKHLRHLSLTGVVLTEDTLKQLHLPSLRTLDLTDGLLEVEAVTSLCRSCPRLQYISLSGTIETDVDAVIERLKGTGVSVQTSWAPFVKREPLVAPLRPALPMQSNSEEPVE